MDIAGSPEARDLWDAVAELLAHAQRAGVARGDVGAADVVALVNGASWAIRHHGGDAGAADRVVAVVSDGLRAVR